MTCRRLKLHVEDNNAIGLSVGEDSSLKMSAGDVINIGGTSDYEDLINKPSINGVELIGDVDSDDLGITVPTKTSELDNDSGYITSSDIPPIPSKTSDLINDEGFISTETDPTVPAWAKTPNKPTYTASEVHALSDNTFIPSALGELDNDMGYITEDDIPPVVTDLGNIDPSDYDDDLEEFLNTLTENGNYKFVWEDGDDFEYFVEIQSMVENGNGYVLQHYWFSEEGAKYQYNRSAYFEDGECTGSDIDNYLTLSDATDAYANKNHNHYETVSKAKTVWDYCDDELQFDNGKPYIIYADTLNSKNWLIERYSATRSPNQRYIRLYDLGDASHFYLRSGLYSAGVITWGDWEEIKPGADEQVKQQYQAESGYSYWRPLLVGKSAAASEGFTPSTVTDQTYAFKTLECQPSTGTIRMGVASMFKGSYESKISPDTLTADRTITIPDKSGTLALTSDITGGGMSITVNGTDYPITAITLTTISGVEGVLVEYDDENNGQLFFADGVGLAAVKSAIEGNIPHDTSELTNGAGFLTISDLPIYNGGVS